MEVIINGERMEIPETVETVTGLLEHYDLGGKVVIVEQNATILEKEAHPHTRISDGDKLELVHFVGGG